MYLKRTEEGFAIIRFFFLVLFFSECSRKGRGAEDWSDRKFFRQPRAFSGGNATGPGCPRDTALGSARSPS